MQEVSNAAQTQGWKGAVKEQTAINIAVQTWAKIQFLNNINTFITIVKNNDIKYFLRGPSQKSDRRASTEITKQLQRDFRFEDIFNGIIIRETTTNSTKINQYRFRIIYTQAWIFQVF